MEMETFMYKKEKSYKDNGTFVAPTNIYIENNT